MVYSMSDPAVVLMWDVEKTVNAEAAAGRLTAGQAALLLMELNKLNCCCRACLARAQGEDDEDELPF